MVKGLWEVETLAAVLTPLAEISQLRIVPVSQTDSSDLEQEQWLGPGQLHRNKPH